MTALDNVLVNLAEAMTKPGIQGILGQRREAQCASDLRMYFRELIRRIPVDEFAALAVKEHAEAAGHTVAMRMRNILRKMRPALLGILATQKLSAFEEAWEAMEVPDGAARKVQEASPLDKLGYSGEYAADWAAKNAAEKVVGIDDTTTSIMQDIIEQGIKDQLGVPGTARLIRAALEDMTRARAELIATTEMNDAYSQAALDKMDRLGLEYKQIVGSPDACDEVCAPNIDQGAIPVGDSFDSGDNAPPFHPRCRCAVVPARAPEGE